MEPSPQGRPLGHPEPSGGSLTGDGGVQPSTDQSTDQYTPLPEHGGPTTRKGRPRKNRTFPDSRALKSNRDRDLPLKRPLVTRSPYLNVRDRLRISARSHGLPTLPGRSSLSLATRYLPGGRESVLSYIALAAQDGDPSAMDFWHVWEDLKPWEQVQVSLDDLCAASGISPSKILKVLVGAAFDAGCDVASLVAAAAHPAVVQASVKYAKEANGIEDRKLLFQHHRFTPIPKGTSIQIGVSANAQAANTLSADQSVPSFLQDVEDSGEAKSIVQGEVIKALPETTATSEELGTLADQFNHKVPVAR
jgi:hypothetical protein